MIVVVMRDINGAGLPVQFFFQPADDAVILGAGVHEQEMPFGTQEHRIAVSAVVIPVVIYIQVHGGGLVRQAAVLKVMALSAAVDPAVRSAAYAVPADRIIFRIEVIEVPVYIEQAFGTAAVCSDIVPLFPVHVPSSPAKDTLFIEQVIPVPDLDQASGRLPVFIHIYSACCCLVPSGHDRLFLQAGVRMPASACGKGHGGRHEKHRQQDRHRSGSLHLFSPSSRSVLSYSIFRPL